MSEPARELRIRWEDICAEGPYRGCWVALRDVSFKEGRPDEGILVDYDIDLGSLCKRVQTGGERGCTIAYCDHVSSGVRRIRR